MTPRGDDWHKPRFPPDGALYEKKLARKLQDLEKRRRKAAARAAAMTPERRARYEHWVRTHKPTSNVARAASRIEAKQNAEMRARLARADGERKPRPAVPPPVAGVDPADIPRPAKEMTMPTKKQTPKDVAAALRQQMQTEGAAIAYEALKDVARDKSAPAQARATAGTSILRAAGFFEKQQDDADSKPLEEMSLEEMVAYNSRQLEEIREFDRQAQTAAGPEAAPTTAARQPTIMD